MLRLHTHGTGMLLPQRAARPTERSTDSESCELRAGGGAVNALLMITGRMTPDTDPQTPPSPPATRGRLRRAGRPEFGGARLVLSSERPLLRPTHS